MAKPRINDSMTAEYVREALIYERHTGVFTWRVRPMKHFRTSRGCNTFNGRYAGELAGTITKVHGCVQIGIDGRSHLAHRLAWLHVTGEWPTALIDHRDLDPANNSFRNLRIATDGQNQWNQRAQANNSSGFKGVSWAPKSRKWWAQIKCAGTHYNLGLFETAEAAHAAYSDAAIRLHGKFARSA